MENAQFAELRVPILRFFAGMVQDAYEQWCSKRYENYAVSVEKVGFLMRNIVVRVYFDGLPVETIYRFISELYHSEDEVLRLALTPKRA